MITFNPLFFIVAFLAILTGQFKNFINLISIILFHELGHVLAGLYYKWKIKKIVILPFGGITVFNEKINRPIKEEFVIAITGPIFQIIYNHFFPNIYHYDLLLFNLLPIVPLDGSKILNLSLNKIFPFSLSHKITLLISLIFIIILLLSKRNFTYFLIVMFLAFKVIEEIKHHKYLINAFLYERYRYQFCFKKRKIIKNFNTMYRDCYHIFKINEKFETEKSVLKKRFDINRRL